MGFWLRQCPYSRSSPPTFFLKEENIKNKLFSSLGAWSAYPVFYKSINSVSINFYLGKTECKHIYLKKPWDVF